MVRFYFKDGKTIDHKETDVNWLLVKICLKTGSLVKYEHLT